MLSQHASFDASALGLQSPAVGDRQNLSTQPALGTVRQLQAQGFLLCSKISLQVLNVTYIIC